MLRFGSAISDLRRPYVSSLISTVFRSNFSDQTLQSIVSADQPFLVHIFRPKFQRTRQGTAICPMGQQCKCHAKLGYVLQNHWTNSKCRQPDHWSHFGRGLSGQARDPIGVPDQSHCPHWSEVICGWRRKIVKNEGDNIGCEKEKRGAGNDFLCLYDISIWFFSMTCKNTLKPS